MTNWQELDDYLSLDHGIDAWQDFSIDRARALLATLSDEQWRTLEQIWPQRSVKWQTQLAQAVFDSSAPRMIPLLRAMLSASDLDVAIAAVESLEGRDDVFWPDDDDRAALHTLLSRANLADQTIIQTLLKRGSASPG
jgi:hypothetical protein